MRHLVLVHQPGCQDASDFRAIAAIVEARVPEIRCFVVDNELPNSLTRKRIADHPTLVVSPGRLHRFQPKRGKIYNGRPMSKIDEMDALRSRGLPVPTYAPLQPDRPPDEKTFGPFVVLKPSHPLASMGEGISLARTRSVRWRTPSEYPPNHLGRGSAMIVQRFIWTGPVIRYHRVVTLFDRVLHAHSWVGLDPVPQLSMLTDEELASFQVRPHKSRRRRHLTSDDDVIALARQVGRAWPDIPLKGIDLIRDGATGELFVLEVNPGGNTWAFSSAFAPSLKEDVGDDLLSQFDAWNSAAEVLIERTLAEAI